MKIGMIIRALSAAYKSLKEENRRQVLVFVIFSGLIPIILLLLAFTIAVYIITSPLSALEAMFGDSYDFATFKNNPEVLQYSAIENYDAIDYEEETIQLGGRDIIYYNQLEAPWKKMLYGLNTTIGESGCGPTSMAIILSTFLQIKVTPAELADWSYANGYLAVSNGDDGPEYSTSHSFIPAVAAAYQLNCIGVAKNDETEEKLKEALFNGKFVVAVMGAGTFTQSGHYIVLTGMSEEGKVYIADCASRVRTNKEWELSDIISEAKAGAGAGGPFWIID